MSVYWQGNACTIAPSIRDYYTLKQVDEVPLLTWGWYFKAPQPADLVTPIDYVHFSSQCNGGYPPCSRLLPQSNIACVDLEDQWREAMRDNAPASDRILAAGIYLNALRATRSQHAGPIDMFKVPGTSDIRRTVQTKASSASWSAWRTAHPMQQAINIMAADIDPLIAMCQALNQPVYLWTKATRQGADADSPPGVVPEAEMRTWLSSCKARWPQIAGWIVLGGDSYHGKQLVDWCLDVMNVAQAAA